MVHTLKRTAIVSERSAKRRRKRKIIVSTISVIGITALISFVMWIAQAEFLMIKGVRVENASKGVEGNILFFVESKLEERVLWLFPRRNTLFFSKEDAAETLIEKYPKIKEIDIKRDALSYLVVEVQERSPAALFCEGQIDTPDDCYFVDSAGYVFTRAPYYSDHVYYELYGTPLVKEDFTDVTQNSATSSEEVGPVSTTTSFLGTQYLPEEIFMTTMLFIENLEEQGIPTHSLTVTSPSLFEAHLGLGGVLKFSPKQDLPKAIEDLKTAYSARVTNEEGSRAEDLEYVDVRFTNKVVFKFAE